MSKLRLIPASGKAHQLDKDEASVGRDPSSDVVIPDGSVSRKHARLIRRGMGWTVIDEGSANGTFLDSHRVAEAQIREGQELRFGAISFRVDVEVPTEELPPTTHRAPEPTLRQPPPPRPPASVSLPVAPPPAPPAPPRAVAPPPLPPRPAARPPSSPPAAQAAPPVRKEGKGPMFWALIGCGGCLTMIVLFIALLAGGAYFFMSGPVTAVEQQIGEIRAGELDKAYARLSESYRARVSKDDFARLVAEHPALKENAEARFWFPSGRVSVANDRAQVSGELVSTSGTREQIACELQREAGEWRITAIRVETVAAR